MRSALIQLSYALVGLLIPALVPTTVTAAAALPCETQDWLKAERSLVITDLSVVNDARAKKSGAWSFDHALQGALPNSLNLGAAAYAWLDQYGTIGSLNGFDLVLRTPGPLLSNWPRTGTPAGAVGPFSGSDELDPAKAPLRLLAVVFRPDLAQPVNAPEGEGRLIFGATDPAIGKKNLTIIFEYSLPAQDAGFNWAIAFAALSLKQFGPEYNATLEALTQRFVNATDGTTHLMRVRANEQYFGQGWDLREFHPDAGGAKLEQVPVAQTPDISLNGDDQPAEKAALVLWLTANSAEVENGTYELPAQFRGASAFLVDDHFTWLTGAGLEESVRANFARNTCNGCHGRETGTRFLHIEPRLAVEKAALSPFLQAQLPIRAAALAAKVCAP